MNAIEQEIFEKLKRLTEEQKLIVLEYARKLLKEQSDNNKPEESTQSSHGTQPNDDAACN
jgi:hypothetical protein